ncbi:MAG: carboxymuconolactone decarboxylase [Thermoleophilia bacterium]|nr:carboxymuconolactone decarboxylase [Thermoleophilia bacterium]
MSEDADASAGDGSTRGERGWATLTRVNGTDDPRVVRRLRELAPDVARHVVEFGYGDMYADRPTDVLDERQRQLVTLGALAAMGGCEDQLAVHANVALEVGLTPDQVVEAITHALPYVGFPRTLNAMEAVRTVFERRGVWTSDAYRGEA